MDDYLYFVFQVNCTLLYKFPQGDNETVRAWTGGVPVIHNYYLCWTANCRTNFLNMTNKVAQAWIAGGRVKDDYYLY